MQARPLHNFSEVLNKKKMGNPILLSGLPSNRNMQKEKDKVTKWQQTR
jgi:hypothetical protein